MKPTVVHDFGSARNNRSMNQLLFSSVQRQASRLVIYKAKCMSVCLSFCQYVCVIVDGEVSNWK